MLRLLATYQNMTTAPTVGFEPNYLVLLHYMFPLQFILDDFILLYVPLEDTSFVL